jgi:hypothetical protein
MCWNSLFGPASPSAERCLLSRCLSSGEYAAKFSGLELSRMIAIGMRAVCGTAHRAGAGLHADPVCRAEHALTYQSVIGELNKPRECRCG